MVSTTFDVSKTSPLDGMVPPVGRVSLREKSYVGKINLRAAGEAMIIAASVLGGDLPVRPNTVVHYGDLTIFWLGQTNG